MSKQSTDFYNEIKQVGKATFIAGLNNSYSGNFSVRISEAGNNILIKRRGAMMGFLKNSDILKITLSPNDKQLKLASTEARIHQAILRNSTARAVLHTHPSYATVLGLEEKEIKPINVESAYYLENIPVLVFDKASASKEMEETLPEYLKKYRVVVIRGHGVFAVGQTLGEALKYTHSAEDAAQIIYLSRMLGFNINKLVRAKYLHFPRLDTPKAFGERE